MINSFDIGVANLYICRITSRECERGRTSCPFVHYYARSRFIFLLNDLRGSISSYVHIDPLLCSTWPGASGPDQGLSFLLTACFAKREAIRYNGQRRDRFIHEVKQYGRVNHACQHRVKYAWHTTISLPFALLISS